MGCYNLDELIIDQDPEGDGTCIHNGMNRCSICYANCVCQDGSGTDSCPAGGSAPCPGEAGSRGLLCDNECLKGCNSSYILQTLSSELCNDAASNLDVDESRNECDVSAGIYGQCIECNSDEDCSSTERGGNCSHKDSKCRCERGKCVTRYLCPNDPQMCDISDSRLTSLHEDIAEINENHTVPVWRDKNKSLGSFCFFLIIVLICAALFFCSFAKVTTLLSSIFASF